MTQKLSQEAEEFLDDQAEHLVRLERLSDKAIDDYADRYIELLNNPDERIPEIAVNIIGYLYVRDSETTGDEDLALAYYTRVDEFLDLSWRQLHSIPLSKRGNFWQSAQSIIDVWCSRQARIESGFVSLVLEQAREHSINKRREWLDLSPTERERLAKASGIAERKKTKEKDQ